MAPAIPSTSRRPAYPCYGYSAIALERDDVRAHGQDERLPIDSYWKSLDFFYAFSKACR